MKPIRMTGTTTFNSYAYLLTASHSLAKTAKEHPPGSNDCRVAAVLLSAFAVEAHLNHLAPELDDSKISWKDKLLQVAGRLKIDVDFGRRPFQTITEIFSLRDRLAHGKTVTDEVKYKYRGGLENEMSQMDPDWLERYWSDAAVDTVLKDTLGVLEEFHAKAGFDKRLISVISEGSFEESI